jgi:hypothetical protein
MTRTFRYLGREWQASNPPTTSFQYADLGVISGASAPSAVGRSPIRLVEFKCVSCQPEWKYESTDVNVADASETQLARTLESALQECVLGTLRDTRWDWRTVDGIARDQHPQMPPSLVRDLLESMPEKVIRSRELDPQGRTLYAAREEYSRKRTFLERLSV